MSVPTLTDFLLARIAEDEVEARALMAEWEKYPPSVYDIQQVGSLAAGDPARVLAECEAKRRIVALHSARIWPAGQGVAEATYCALCGPGRWPCETHLALATPYADHPAYRQEWKP